MGSTVSISSNSCLCIHGDKTLFSSPLLVLLSTAQVFEGPLLPDLALLLHRPYFIKGPLRAPLHVGDAATDLALLYPVPYT